jgi:hypothetical protein
MGWLLRRVLTVWFVLIGSCTAAVVLARVAQAPGALQAFGFDVCEGVPCFWGIKPGMSWEAVQARAADGKGLTPNLMEFEIGNHRIAVRQDQGTVSQIKVLTMNSGRSQDRMTIGAIIAQYGPPCAVRINERDDRSWEISYPNSVIEVVLIPAKEELGIALRKIGVSNTFIRGALTEPKLRLYSDLPVHTFTVRPSTPCKVVRNDLNGTWRGLTTADAYRALYRRSASVRQ